jgi:hypothetical protein
LCIEEKVKDRKRHPLWRKRGEEGLANRRLKKCGGRKEEDAAAGGEQRLLMVVGEPHPHQAVQMARQQPPRSVHLLCPCTLILFTFFTHL